MKTKTKVGFAIIAIIVGIITYTGRQINNIFKYEDIDF